METQSNTIFHTSPEAITNIDDFDRMFDDCLFFSRRVYVMTRVADYKVYSLEIADENIIEVGRFFYLDDCDKLSGLVDEIKELCDCDSDDAEELLSERADIYDFIDDATDAAEASWKIQALQGKAAKLLGYEAAQSEDEQGTVYIVPMLGRESDLIECDGTN